MDEEKFIKQFDYSANSNLVLPTDTSLSDKRPSNEATGEVQTLKGRISGKMGDRIDRSSKKDLVKQEEDENRRSKSKRRERNEASKLKQVLSEARSFSVADIDIKDLLYQPKTEPTKVVYGLIIKFIRKQLGFQPTSIINGAADEVIAAMKNPNYNEEMKRLEVDKLLSSDAPLTNEDFNELSNLCKRITDWYSSHGNDDVGEEEELGGVGVVYEEGKDDASSDDYLSEVPDSGEDEFDLEEMFEKAQDEATKVNEKLINLDEIAKKQINIAPKIEIGEPIRKEGYLEYHINPKKRNPPKESDLIRIKELPENFRKAFEDFKTLNIIQSCIYEKAAKTDKSLLICAPTGAGKTNIAILTMLREITKFPKRDGFDTDKFKIIYVAPIKALVQEIVENFTRRLGCAPYKLKVGEFTGDTQLTQREISRYQIIVCTPEKWDIATRKSEERPYTKLVKLVIFDEIHLLHNERGATLEALIARIKRHQQLEGERIRIIGLSATLPNYKDVANFIAPNEPDATQYFDSTYRPIPLRQEYIAMTGARKAFKMSNDIVYEKVIKRLLDSAQILIFVHSRLETTKTAEFIKCQALKEQKLGLFLSSESAIDKVNEYGKNLRPKLKELLQFGIGIHHAGLSRPERACVEELFRGKYIKVLVSTATLAWGVNLPARTVIIKETHVYRNGEWTELDSLDVTQMLGRAGRPGFDKEGEGIVITQQSQVHFYMSLMTEQLPVESKLIGRLAEFINSECVIGNIECLRDAVSWISETYLNSRMTSVLNQYAKDSTKNKQYLTMYGIDPSCENLKDELESHKHKLAYTAASLLDDRGLIVFDRSSGVIQSTELGRIASHLNCSSRTIKLFYDSIHEYTSDIELLRTFSLADEFKEVFVRKGEEVDLQALYNQVPFPVDDKRATPGANKVNALLQVYIFRMNIETSDLINDMRFIKDNAARLASAIHEVVLMKGYSSVAELSIDLCRKINKRMTICHSQLRQFSDDLEPDIINRLEKKNYNINELRALDAEKLSELIRCDRSHGKKVYTLLKYLPKLKIEASVKPISKNSLSVEITILPEFLWDNNYHGSSERFWLLLKDVNKEVLLHYEIIHIRKEQLNEFKTTFFVPYLRPVNPFYYLGIFPENWFGCDQHLPIYIERLTLPDEYVPTTQPIDLEPLTIKSLEDHDLEAVYRCKFKGASFNQIQSQSFDHIYSSDDDVILLAPSGSGKTTCVDLGIFRSLKYGNLKCGYITPNFQSAQVVYKNWQELAKEISTFSINSLLLTGNPKVDAAQVDKSNVNLIIGDVESWHKLTLIRMKKYSKLLTRFQLFVIDNIHLLRTDSQSLLDNLCSKIRVLTKLYQEKAARIIATGSPMLCAESLRSWLALERATRGPVLLNYPLAVRPVRLELVVQKFHHYDYRMRLLTMQRPVYRCITQNARDRPVMLYVADYGKALEVCEMLTNYAKNENRCFNRSIINTNELHERKLREYVSKGVGYIYRGMNRNDFNRIEDLYNSGQIQILVITVSMCWSVQCRSYLTIVMDTQHHNGKEGTEYELTDIVQMVGLTGRQLADHECKCVVMCHSSKGAYYDRFLNEPLPVESELPKTLITHINYEIAAGTLTDLNSISKVFLAPTFFCKRISINPNYYGIIIPEDPEQKTEVLRSYFRSLVEGVITELDTNKFIRQEGRDNPTFEPLHLCLISHEFYINYETLVNYSKWLSDIKRPLELKTVELIELIANYTQEFDNIPIRHGELKELKRLQERYKVSDSHSRHSYSHSLKLKLLILSQYQKNRGDEDRKDEVEGELIEDHRYVITTCYRLLMAVVEMAQLEDSFSLVKTSMQLAKKLVPFYRSTVPNLSMETTNISRDDDQIRIDIVVTREDDPYSLEEFDSNSHKHQFPRHMYRDEGWKFILHGVPRSKKEVQEKVILCQRLKIPAKGTNKYKLLFEFPEKPTAYTYDLYLMSDFYSTREDRKVPDMPFHSLLTT